MVEGPYLFWSPPHPAPPREGRAVQEAEDVSSQGHLSEVWLGSPGPIVPATAIHSVGQGILRGHQALCRLRARCP